MNIHVLRIMFVGSIVSSTTWLADSQRSFAGEVGSRNGYGEFLAGPGA